MRVDRRTMCEFTSSQYFQELERQREALVRKRNVLTKKEEIRRETETKIAEVRRSTIGESGNAKDPPSKWPLRLYR